MRDIPMFTTEYGVASLVLREIPYRQEAYITLQATDCPEQLLTECVSFCRMCGAEKIYAQNHDFLERYPVHAEVVKMRGIPAFDEDKARHLWPVTEETVTRWRQFMNERLKNVDNASTLEARDDKDILSRGGAYFVHDNGHLLGGGWLTDGQLLLLAAAERGAGETVMQTLLSLQPGAPVELEVASTNTPAIRLYEKMGLVAMQQLRKWHKIFPADK